MSDVYNPTDWYWLVSGDATKAFSSAAGNYVLASNAAYQAWLARGNTPTSIATESELGDVLAPYQVRPVAAGVLDGYKDSQATKLTIDIVAKVLFNHENRLRALEGAQPVTAGQFKTALKGLM